MEEKVTSIEDVKKAKAEAFKNTEKEHGLSLDDSAGGDSLMLIDNEDGTFTLQGDIKDTGKIFKMENVKKVKKSELSDLDEKKK
jgi:hypothetical protein